MHFTFLITENCFTSGITGLIDAFAIANLWQSKLTGCNQELFTVGLVSDDGKPITSCGCVELHPHTSLVEAGEVQYIIVPPVFPSPELGQQLRGPVKRWLIENKEKGVPIAAVCTGAFLLAETGMLDGRMATTNWQFVRKFGELFPKVRLLPKMILTEDDGLLCTGAATAYLNLALHLIKKFGSAELAGVCAKALLIDSNRISQAPYFVEQSMENHTDTAIKKAQRFMEENYAEIRAIDDIAEYVGISSRHFKRRFKQAVGSSPLASLQNIRIRQAKKRLESTLESIEEITFRVGYENASTFRRLFKARTSLSPKEYRDRFLNKKETLA